MPDSRKTLAQQMADRKWEMAKRMGYAACPADGEKLYPVSGTWRCPKCGRTYTPDEIKRMRNR